MDNMFEQLMNLPLFQGVSHEHLENLIEKLPFHFLKFNDGDRIIQAREECTHLRFIVSGTVRAVTASEVSRFSVSQRVDAPNVIGPNYLFGRHTHYPYDVYAVGTTGILQLRKCDYMTILQSDEVFLFNILNYLSHLSQKQTYSLLSQSRGMIAERLARLILYLTGPSSYDIVLHFKQKDLCMLLGARRTSLVNAIDELEARGVISHAAGAINVLDRSALVRFMKHDS